jgi:hypothetical protein
MKMYKIVVMSLSLACLAGIARANPSITVGDVPLQPGMSQQVLLHVTGATAIQSAQVACMIEDGGQSGPVVGPQITGLELRVGTIFEGYASVYDQLPDTGPYLPTAWLASRSIITDSGTVSANGVFAVLTIDTTGYSPGQSWTLSLTGTPEGNTHFGDDIIPDVVNGRIFIVPEPISGLVVAAGAGLLLLGRVSSRRRK